MSLLNAIGRSLIYKRQSEGNQRSLNEVPADFMAWTRLSLSAHGDRLVINVNPVLLDQFYTSTAPRVVKWRTTNPMHNSAQFLEIRTWTFENILTLKSTFNWRSWSYDCTQAGSMLDSDLIWIRLMGYCGWVWTVYRQRSKNLNVQARSKMKGPAELCGQRWYAVHPSGMVESNSRPFLFSFHCLIHKTLISARQKCYIVCTASESLWYPQTTRFCYLSFSMVIARHKV